jgi:hypothetical protein
VKLALAYRCYNCREIFERAPSGACPFCTSDRVVALSWVVKLEAERAVWLQRIRGPGRRHLGYRPRAAERPHTPRSCAASANQLERKVA